MLLIGIVGCIFGIQQANIYFSLMNTGQNNNKKHNIYWFVFFQSLFCLISLLLCAMIPNGLLSLFLIIGGLFISAKSYTDLTTIENKTKKNKTESKFQNIFCRWHSMTRLLLLTNSKAVYIISLFNWLFIYAPLLIITNSIFIIIRPLFFLVIYLISFLGTNIIFRLIKTNFPMVYYPKIFLKNILNIMTFLIGLIFLASGIFHFFT